MVFLKLRLPYLWESALGTYLIKGCVGPRAAENAVEKRKISTYL
jgi:hypothetical protein